MEAHHPVKMLLARGVNLPQPETVFIAGDVVPERIAAVVTIHPGCRLTGNKTSVGPGCELGAEAPVTLCDCQLGERVSLQGGAFREATFLNGAAMAGGAHVRPGTAWLQSLVDAATALWPSEKPDNG